MKKIEDRQLARLSSMKELQTAKRKINRAMRGMEADVKDDYHAALEMFSWREVLSYGVSIADSLQSVVRYMGKGLYSGIVTGLANGLRRRRKNKAMRRQGCGCGC